MKNYYLLKRIFITFLTILVIISSSVIARSKRKKRFDCNQNFNKALTHYKDKHYNRTKTILNEAKLHCSGHPTIDSALYYLGMSCLKTKQPSEARMEFEVLIQDYPKSPFFIEAHYLIGVCSFKESRIYERDQAETKDAVREFNNFIDQFPQSHLVDSARYYINICKEKLARKDVESARFYEKIDQFNAAIVYYKIIIEQYPDIAYIPECRLALANNLVKVNRQNEAIEIIEKLLKSKVNPEIKKKAKLLRTRITITDEKKTPKKDQESILHDSTNSKSVN